MLKFGNTKKPSVIMAAMSGNEGCASFTTCGEVRTMDVLGYSCQGTQMAATPIGSDTAIFRARENWAYRLLFIAGVVFAAILIVATALPGAGIADPLYRQ